MKLAFAIVTLLAASAATIGAAAGGGPSPGLDFGSGVVLPGGKVRYVALTTDRGTLVEAVRTHGGQIGRARYLRGIFGIPLVDYNGTTGGLARNGRRLVVASPPGPAVTRFVVLDPRNLRVRAHLRLRGTWAFDALSPGGSLMYLIQYLGVPGSSGQRYAVRSLNLNTGRLYSGSILDRREPDEKMTGIPLTRAESINGWAYTLYSRTNKSPFVHALDTVHRRAFCVDLPWRPSVSWLGRVTLRVSGHELLLRVGRKTVASVDTKTFDVTRG